MAHLLPGPMSKLLSASAIAASSLLLRGIPAQTSPAQSQTSTANTAQSILAPSLTPPSSRLELTPEKVSHLQSALDARDFVAAEQLLIAEIEQDPHSTRAAHLLAYLGGIYFLNHDSLNAAVAWKKSSAITPLDPGLQFSLAMAYINIGHSDWARTELLSLAARNPKNSLYPYWIGRIEYDAHRYPEAIQSFQQAIDLDPAMARAYDNLGLCYYSQNENHKAIESFQKAIDLDQGFTARDIRPSPWPYLNLAITLDSLGQTQKAEANLRQALKIDPQFAPAHYHLGSVLEEQHHPEAAVNELLEASWLDQTYAEPHIALAHVYHELGQEEAAKVEVETYLKLRRQNADSNPSPKP